ncbi:MAG: hypothetical protein JW839_14845 [Candidatus Lokiarchaeota archaeon]|nr:hypothetical protein [Candidatus Lokiarchaeota archaeon]
MTWDTLVVDEKERGETHTLVLLVDDRPDCQHVHRIIAETRDDYEHLDACMNPGKTRAIVFRMQEVGGERDECIDVYDPLTLKPVISLTNWPVGKIAFSRDGKLMYLQATLETGTPIEAVLDLFSGDKVEGVSRTKDGVSLVNIAELLKQRKRIEKKIG